MRTKGSKGINKCWTCDVYNQGEVIFSDCFITLRDVAEKLGMTYNQVVEISSDRKKQPKGFYDTTYKIYKITPTPDASPEVPLNDEEVLEMTKPLS